MFVAEILQVPGTATTPTNTRSSQEKINTSPATRLTLTDPLIGVRNDVQHLDTDAVTNAVVASIRHDDTRYDALLMSGIHRPEARRQVRPDIDHVLDIWRGCGTRRNPDEP